MSFNKRRLSLEQFRFLLKARRNRDRNDFGKALGFRTTNEPSKFKEVGRQNSILLELFRRRKR